MIEKIKMKKGLIKEATRLQQLAGILKESDLGAAYAERELDGDASRQMHEEASQGEVINLYHLDDEELPDEAVSILDKGTISNEEYITRVLGKSVDFDSDEARDEGAYSYNEVPFSYLVDLGILTDSNTLAKVEIGGTYVDNYYFFDQGNGYVVTEEDYTGSWGVTTKEAAEEAIQLMKTV